jgi:hypothetical protein
VACPSRLCRSATASCRRARGAVKVPALGIVGSGRASRALRPGAMHNQSVEATPNSYACKARLGQNAHRPCRALHAPLLGSPHLQR